MRRKREAPAGVPSPAIRERAGRPHGTSRWLALGVVLSALAIAGCGGDGDLPAQLAPSNGPDQEVRGFTLTESVGSLMRWRLTARSAATYRNRGVILAQTVSIDFFDASGKPYSHLTADQGEIHPTTNDMVASGHVSIITNAGTRVDTPSLRFLNREQKVESDERVTVRRGGDVLSGVGFESDPSLDHFEFKTKVSAQVKSAGGHIRVHERGTKP
jgi:LPS export ABC transporter protein LptC